MKFLPGPAIAQASGSVGGQTFSRNRSGAYIRTRAIPVNPSSSRQSTVRAIFSTLVNAWNNLLSQAERDGWNLYASNIIVKDKLGQDITWTGMNHFVRSNSVVLAGGEGRVDVAPSIFTFADTDPTAAATVDEAGQEISLAFDDTLAWAGEDDALMQVAMSRPQNGGRQFIDPVFRVAGFLPGNTATPLTSPQVLDAPFPVTTGQSVLVQMRILRADGRLSEPFRHSSVVVA